MLNYEFQIEQENRAVTTLSERTYQASERLRPSMGGGNLRPQDFRMHSESQAERIPRDEETSDLLSLSTKQPEPPAKQYSGGWFDGLIGEKPRYPELKVYWSGYQQGLREYYANLAGIELPNDC